MVPTTLHKFQRMALAERRVAKEASSLSQTRVVPCQQFSAFEMLPRHRLKGGQPAKGEED